MYRIDVATAATSIPTPAAVGPKPDGFFTDGNPGTGVPATVVEADWLNAVQEELMNLLTQGGIAESKTDRTTVYQAILAIIGGNDSSPVINGSCIFGQLNGGRPQGTLSTSYQYAGVDRFAAAVTGGAVSAGTIQQESTALIGTSGFSLSLLGVTTTGAGVVSVRYRMESKDVIKYKNIAAIIADLNVYQDTGGSINYTITINKANSVDNFSAVTQIGQSANIPVATATATRISFSVAPGDCSNGLEIIISAACGALTTKNYRFNQLQVRTGSVLKQFQQGKLAEIGVQCARYFQWVGAGMTGFCANTTAIGIAATLGISMRVTPTFVGVSKAYTVAVANTTVTSTAVLPTSTVLTSQGVSCNVTGFTGLTAGTGCVMDSTNIGSLDSEL